MATGSTPKAAGRCLLVLQGMDTAGKDGTIRHVMRGFNPQSCQVTSFKQPGVEELAHDFLWRIDRAAAAQGIRGHLQPLALRGRAGGAGAQAGAQERMGDPLRADQPLREDCWSTGAPRSSRCSCSSARTEQRRRLQARLDDPDKRWKFSRADVKERGYWDEYHRAYEEALTRCNTDTPRGTSCRRTTSGTAISSSAGSCARRCDGWTRSSAGREGHREDRGGVDGTSGTQDGLANRITGLQDDCIRHVTAGRSANPSHAKNASGFPRSGPITMSVAMKKTDPQRPAALPRRGRRRARRFRRRWSANRARSSAAKSRPTPRERRTGARRGGHRDGPWTTWCTQGRHRSRRSDGHGNCGARRGRSRSRPGRGHAEHAPHGRGHRLALKARFKAPVAIGNDCNFGALGETWLGSARKANSALDVCVGTGIGGGFVQRGKLWRGDRESAAEIGHIVMQIGRPDVRLRQPRLPRGAGQPHRHRARHPPGHRVRPHERADGDWPAAT